MPVNNFNFRNPTRILFGKDTIPELNKYLPHDKHFIICYGYGSIKKNGVYDSLVKTLDTRKYEDFSGIEANPDYDTLMKCVNRCKEIGVDQVYLLAVGGGSIADGVKFIAAACCYEGDPWNMVLEGGANVRKAVPMSCILTLPATGSESNPSAVISYRKLNRKQAFKSEHVYPEISVLDPDTMLSLPLKQIQNGVVDAFVHVCEQYATTCEDADCQDRYSEGLLLALVKNGERIMKDQTDYVARSNIMWAANQALNTLIAQGVKEDWATHMIGHELTANLGLDHGQTLAIVQPRLFELKLQQKQDKLAMLGAAVFQIKEGTAEERAKSTIAAIENFYRNVMGVKTKISELECSQDKAWIDTLCARLESESSKWGEHGDITHVEVRDILNRSY